MAAAGGGGTEVLTRHDDVPPGVLHTPRARVSSEFSHRSAHRQMLTVHRIDADRWVDFERLFEIRGRLRGCWCMVFRASVHGKVPPPDQAARKHAMHGLVAAGVPVGLLGYSDGVPVA